VTPSIGGSGFFLLADGWSITEVKQCAFVGGDQGGNVIFQVVVTAAEGQKAGSLGR
jgi:hypothetical protein